MTFLLYSFITLFLVSLMSFCVIIYQNFILHPLSSAYLSLFSECSLIFSAFCCPLLLFLFLFFPLPCLSFLLFSPLSFCPFILVVSPDLLLLRPTCQDHRDQFSTTRQHLSSCCIRHGSERPLSSCLLLSWMVGAVRARVCVCACACICVCVRVRAYVCFVPVSRAQAFERCHLMRNK